MVSADTQRLLDRVAIASSALCAVHCVLTPTLVVALPVLASTLFADEEFHRWMLAAVIPSSVVALWLGCRRHKNRWVLAFGAVGLVLLIVAAFWGHDLFGELGEKVITIIGGSVLAAGHWINYRSCRTDNCET